MLLLIKISVIGQVRQHLAIKRKATDFGKNFRGVNRCKTNGWWNRIN